MTYDQWVHKFNPIQNDIIKNAPFNGMMFDTSENELEEVRRTYSYKVWTYLQGDDGTYIVAGYHFVNRIGHFITRNVWDDTETTIKVD